MWTEIGKRTRSVQYALAGWRHVFRTQPNAWIHAFVSVGIVIMGIWLRIPARDWALLILAFMAVWIAEFLNTALEAIVDMTAPAPHPLAKVAKDVAAAAVLIGALGAILVGLLVLGPPLWQRIQAG